MTSWTGPGGIAAGAARAVGGTHPKANLPQAHTYTLLTMKGHAFTAYLRIYQPLAAFPPRERVEWACLLYTSDAADE